MKYTGELRIPALGFSWPVEVELELADAPAPEHETMDDPALCARWKRAPRTTKRLRDQGRLPYLQPTPRTILYRLADVRAFEEANYRGAVRRMRRSA